MSQDSDNRLVNNSSYSAKRSEGTALARALSAVKTASAESIGARQAANECLRRDGVACGTGCMCLFEAAAGHPGFAAGDGAAMQGAV